MLDMISNEKHVKSA